MPLPVSWVLGAGRVEVARWGARRCGAHVDVGDQRGPARQVVRVDQAVDGNRDEVAVADVQVAVGEGQPAGLGDQVDGLIVERVVAEVERLEDAQDLADGQPTGRRRAHAADLVAPVVDTDRFPLDDGVVGQIVGGHVARDVPVALHRCGDVLGDLPAVETAVAGGGQGQHRLGVRPILHHRARRLRRAVRVGEVLERRRVPEEQPLLTRRVESEPAADLGAGPLRDLEPGDRLGQRRTEGLRSRQQAVAVVGVPPSGGERRALRPTTRSASGSGSQGRRTGPRWRPPVPSPWRRRWWSSRLWRRSRPQTPRRRYRSTAVRPDRASSGRRPSRRPPNHLGEGLQLLRRLRSDWPSPPSPTGGSRRGSRSRCWSAWHRRRLLRRPRSCRSPVRR